MLRYYVPVRITCYERALLLRLLLFLGPWNDGDVIASDGH